MEPSRGSAGFGVVIWSASGAEISGGLRSPGVALPLQTACPRSCRSDRRGSAQTSCRAGVHERLCENSSTWLGREEIGVEGEEEGREEGVAGRQAEKPPDLVFPKPSSYIANAWSNMGSFIMDKPLAPACKVYHVHCKEVKDWVVFARNVVTTSGPCISVCYCCECGMQGGVSALQSWKPGGPDIQTGGGKPRDISTHPQRVEF